MSLFLPYVQRIAGGSLLGLLLLTLLRPAPAGARVAVHIALFILLRDAMTPLGLWTLSSTPVFWLRLGSDPARLSALACSTAGIVIASYRLEPELARGVVWLRRGAPRAIAASCAAAMLIAAPVLAQSWSVPVAARGGELAAANLLALFVFSVIGNTYEELLFRGFLQGSLEPHLGPTRAACVSAVSFGFGHVFLSATVTDLGSPILVFTLYEGFICAFLCRGFGLLASALAHGGGIFLIASGLL